MTINEPISLNEDVIIFNRTIPCENKKHIWSTHIVISKKDGDIYKTEMKKCVKCEIVKDMKPKKEQIVDTH